MIDRQPCSADVLLQVGLRAAGIEDHLHAYADIGLHEAGRGKAEGVRVGVAERGAFPFRRGTPVDDRFRGCPTDADAANGLDVWGIGVLFVPVLSSVAPLAQGGVVEWLRRP